ncbi:MAG: hypothetical protein ACKV2V_18935 [Blastocatellia bacterium]
MRKNILVKQWLLMLTLITLILVPAMALPQTAPKGSSSEFAAFWKEFKTAVAADDKEAVAGMTKLPIYLENKARDKAGFLKLYPKLFSAKVKKYFATAKPVKEYNEDSYSVFCGQTIYVFSRVDGKYKFTDMGVND